MDVLIIYSRQYSFDLTNIEQLCRVAINSDVRMEGMIDE